MYIYKITSSPQFKAFASKDVISEYSGVPAESEFLKLLRAGRTVPINSINPKTKETIFQGIIEENYTKLVSYLLARGVDFSEVINKPNLKGLSPLDCAKTEEMAIMLKRAGGIHLKGRPIGVQEPAGQTIDDAKTIAAKEYMTQPVMEKVTESAAKSENNQETASFFDSFEEVEESTETKAVANVEETSLQHSAQEVTDADWQLNSEKTKVEKPKPKELDISGLKDFRRLEITENDVLSIDDLIGQTAVKDELKTNVVAPLKDEAVSNKLKENKIDLPNGILIEGSGGEITVIKALSNEAEIPVIIMENPQELPQMLTAIEARYKKTGKKTAILAQGFDKYFPEGNQNNVQANAFRNSLKGIKNKGALFIATTSDKSLIGCDFMKSGIIDKVLEVVKPDEADRTEFFKRHFEGKEVFNNMANDETISELVMLTDNRSYADILRVLDETARTATANGKNADIETFEEQLKDFSKELDIVPITPENRTASYDRHIKRIPVSPNEMMSLDELGGAFKIKEELRDLYVDPIIHSEKLVGKKVAEIPDGAIFYGDPGNGKSTIARVLARELKLPYYQINLSDIGKDSLVGQASRDFKDKVQDLKDKYQATKAKGKPEMSVLFLDEFDSIGAARGENQAQHVKELTDTLLQVLDNPAEYGIILIAATNNLQDIDPALKRSGRLGNHIKFENPNHEEIKDTIIKLLSKHDDFKKYTEDDEWVTGVEKDLDGFAYSSIRFVLDNAMRDYYLHDTDFKQSIKKAVDKEVNNLLGQLCGTTQLTQHVYSELAPKSLDELSGMSDVIQQLRKKVMLPWDPEIRKELLENGIEPSGGFMLEGPSGGGKTTVIETLAREMGIPLFKVELDDEKNQYVGGIDNSIKQIFGQMALIAKVRKGPVMLFFDEAERFFPLTSAGLVVSHDIKQTNHFKTIMNEAASKGIILAGATNHINLVNQEVIGNPRRMGNVIHCGTPNLSDRKAILNRLLVGHPRITEEFTPEDIEYIAAATDGFSIGDLSQAVKDIITQAVFKREKLTPKKVVEEFITDIVPKHIV